MVNMSHNKANAENEKKNHLFLFHKPKKLFISKPIIVE